MNGCSIQRSSDLRFREIESKDNAVIADLIRRTLKSYSLDIPGTAYFDEGLDRFNELYGRDEARYYVLEDDAGRVIGGIGFSSFPMIEGAAELQKLYLDETAAGGGIGYGMITFVEDRMREAGFKRSYLETHDNLSAAIHIYEKSGYMEMARPDFVGHSAMTRFYIKEL